MEMSKPSWAKLTEAELKNIIVELSKKNQPAQIGLILRDQYGIPTTRVVYGKKLSSFLKELNIPASADLQNVQKKFERIKEHLQKNKGDKKTKHKMQKAQGRLNKLKKYLAA